MSIERNIAKSIAGFFFFVFIGFTLILMSLTTLTEYDSIKDIVTKVIQQQPPQDDFTEDQKQEIILNLKKECEGKEFIEGESIPIEGGANVLIKCSSLQNVTDFNSLTYAAVVDTLYYKKYQCAFLDCMRTGEYYMPLIISETAHKFYQQTFIYSLIATIIIGVIFVFLIEDNKSRLKSLGWVLIVSSIPFVALNLMIDYVVGVLAPQQTVPLLQSVLKNIFTPMVNIYIYLLIAGIALTTVGYIMKSSDKTARKIHPM
jgi:hypothetical protein